MASARELLDIIIARNEYTDGISNESSTRSSSAFPSDYWYSPSESSRFYFPNGRHYCESCSYCPSCDSRNEDFSDNDYNQFAAPPKLGHGKKFQKQKHVILNRKTRRIWIKAGKCKSKRRNRLRRI